MLWSSCHLGAVVSGRGGRVGRGHVVPVAVVVDVQQVEVVSLLAEHVGLLHLMLMLMMMMDHRRSLHALSLNSLDVGVVHKVASRTVRTVASGVKRATQLGLVLGVAHHVAQLMAAVSKLTLVAILARAILLERATQLRLVARGRHGGRSCSSGSLRAVGGSASARGRCRVVV